MCDDLHKEYDPLANGPAQIGELPLWMNINGKVAWYVHQGPYSELMASWLNFSKQRHAMNLQMRGPPGEVSVCDPDEHGADGGKRVLTILWAPVKD